ncbi:acetyl-CoA synthetase-like protein [Coprinellus micaceus]|uniref:Acetyl-CoA synthetase-like protein n=1 Tax=Coprinellus micaceus TaxID=71717 RepID=A0A4Y7TW46_COPMI|nr:acetyl-CoA synthetase-like protein [Coprinellus micaceus]
MSWSPKRSLADSKPEALLTAPGSIHETQTALVDGRLYKVYKNLWPSLREFWLAALTQYAHDTYIVYEDRRLSYREVHDQAMRVASLMRTAYNIQKGDRVGICSRNSPEYLIIFWACHLIGAVAVLANAWLPVDPLRHCLSYTDCKLIFVDSERADLLAPFVSSSSVSSSNAPKIPAHFIVIDTSTSRWVGISPLRDALAPYTHPLDIEALQRRTPIYPEDNATIIFTSGTTGLPKGVLSTQRQFLTNVLNVLVGGFRAALRRGDGKAALVAVPLFHVTGSTSYSMMATLTGMKIILMKKWEPEEAVKLIKKENVAVAGGVPSMVSDLIESSLVGHPLEGLLFGGAPAPDSLVPRAREAFPTATMIQGYGLTETNSIAVSASGEDYLVRPKSTGRASPVNEIRIVRDGKAVDRGQVGEVWLRGPNVMKEYWRDPEATRKVITVDGWLRSGDLGYLDEEDFLYIKDRSAPLPLVKDIIIRGGENIDSVSVENALYADPRVHEAAAVGVPDERLGELVAAVVSVKPSYWASVTEGILMAAVRTRLPRFAVPVMIVVHNQPFEHTPSGKIIKSQLREIAKQHWEARKRSSLSKYGKEPTANL